MKARILRMLDNLSTRDKWVIEYACKWLFLILVITLYTIIIARVGYAKAEKEFEAWKEDWSEEYVSEFLKNQEAAEINMTKDPYESQLDTEARSLAKVLYGVRENNTDDLRTYCWCVFNRVDSKEYADTLEEVIAQPSQWMRYSEDNPVTEDLFNLARAELDSWHTGDIRPCSPDFVFMSWSPSEIVLRNTWTNTSKTTYWRIR